VNPTRDNAVGDTGFEPVPLPGQRSISAWEFRRVWGLEPVQGRLCLPPCGVVGRLEQASERARGRCRIVAVPKAFLRTGTVSPVVATGWWARPNSSYAYQCVAAPLVSPA
jgi:hypothetical protein